MTAAGRPDLVVHGRIATLAGAGGAGWVEAIAIAGGRIMAAGSWGDVSALAGAGTRVLRLTPDEIAIPGITDAHLHLAEAALSRTRADLEGAGAIGELIERVREFAALRHASAPGGGGDDPRDPERWIEGGGWDPDSLGRWPTADDLDTAAPGRRVALWAHDHHSLLVSHAGLAAAGIDGRRTDPDGGVIRRDSIGTPTGVLHERAASLVADIVPAPSESVAEAAVEAYVARLLALGITAVHDPGSLAAPEGLGAAIAAYRSLAAAGRLWVRVHAAIRAEQLDAVVAAGLRSGAPLGPDPLDRLRLGWLKLFADGTLGSRTAALLEPLAARAGEPPPPNDGFGVWMTPPNALTSLAGRAAAAGIATQVHAIGDAAVRAAVDALAPTAGATALMPRVEHAQLVAPADVPRFAAGGIAASVQPVHLRSDAAAARRLWGERAERNGYPYGALTRSGAVVAFGTDAPIEPPDPWPGIACAVTRAAPGWPAGTPPLGLANAVGLWRAIRAACVDPAVSAGEHDRGRLVVGSRADVVVIAATAVAEPVETGGPLWHARPRLVLVDGVVASGELG